MEDNGDQSLQNIGFDAISNDLLAPIASENTRRSQFLPRKVVLFKKKRGLCVSYTAHLSHSLEIHTWDIKTSAVDNISVGS